MPQLKPLSKKQYTTNPSTVSLGDFHLIVRLGNGTVPPKPIH